MPSNQQLNDQYVQIVILTKQEFKSNRNAPADFINKWTGFLSDINVEESTFQYLN